MKNPMTTTMDNPIGSFLKARRARLDPAACGFEPLHRRTPGLRREEVAQRANISAKWYTFLEQGRGGAPSVDVVYRLSQALKLSDAERDHLLHLIQPRHAPAADPAGEKASPALLRMLDMMECIPAFVKTAAGNPTATAITRDRTGWNPQQPGLLADLRQSGYLG